MQNVKMVAGIIGFISLWFVTITAPAYAQEQCQIRPLDQGSGNVKICVPVK